MAMFRHSVSTMAALAAIAALAMVPSSTYAQGKPDEKPAASAAPGAHNGNAGTAATPTAPADSITEGTVTVGGEKIDYRAIAGTLTVGGSEPQDATLGLDATLTGLHQLWATGHGWAAVTIPHGGTMEP